MAKRAENAVADIRDRIAELKAEKAAVQAKPAAQVEVEASIDAHLRYHSEQYLARFEVERLKQRGSLEGLGEKDDSFFAFFFSDTIKTALMREAGDGMADGDRSAEITRLDEALLGAEREEEKTICEAEKRGHQITRRADADPRAVLELE